CRAGEFQAYHLGGGQGVSIAEVIARARVLTGREIRAIDAPRRAGDPPVLVADIALARQALDWEPKHSGIDDVIRTAWSWMTKAR
ncbi:MAG: UDP-glucose 4-epimerase GalE, partial [Reyranella sp.]|nr:UDP-glucose 4-epimerase GalE [Reyranella sp.]